MKTKLPYVKPELKAIKLQTLMCIIVGSKTTDPGLAEVKVTDFEEDNSSLSFDWDSHGQKDWGASGWDEEFPIY